MARAKIHGWMVAPEQKRRDALFHYTSGIGAHGILESGQVYASLCKTSNDESEIEYGKSIISEHLRKFISSKYRDGDEGVLQLDRQGADIESFPSSYIELIYHCISESVGIFTFCFCRHSDPETYQHGLLSQWRGYGVGGGYAIQFSKAELQKVIRSINRKKNGVNAYLRPVQYGKNGRITNKTQSVLDELSGHFYRHISRHINLSWRKGDNTTISPLENFSGDLLSALLDHMAFVKNAHFSEEREWRLAIFAIIKESNDIRFREKGGLILPHFTFPLEGRLSSAIERIIVGPHADQQARYDAINVFCNAKGRRIERFASGIPLGGT